MLLTTLLLMQGPVQAPEDAATPRPEAFSALPRLFSAENTVELSGRVQMDFAWIDDDNFGTRDGSELRRAWLGARGSLAEGIDWKMEVDLADLDGGPGGFGDAFRDVYVKFSDLPVGSIQVGQFKEPFSLNFLTSSKHITFTERATTFAPGWNMGVMASDNNDNLTWQVGGFWETNAGTDPGVETDNNTALTGRVVFRPYMENEGERLAHLGLALSLREEEDDVVAAGSNGGVHLLDGMIVGGAIPAMDGSTLIGFESAIQEGPMWGQFEFVTAEGDDDGLVTWYLSGGYFLTGESRSYSGADAAWHGVTPNTPYGNNGNGAWEVAARVGAIDLSDAAVNNEAITLAVALNWYLTQYTRVGFDVYLADSDPLADDILAAVVRFGFYF